MQAEEEAWKKREEEEQERKKQSRELLGDTIRREMAERESHERGSDGAGPTDER